MSKERDLLKRSLNAMTKQLMAGPLIAECLESIDEIQAFLAEPEPHYVEMADYVELQRKHALLILEYKDLEQTFNHATGTQWIRKPLIEEKQND